MEKLKRTINNLIDNEHDMQTKFMLTGQYIELCKSNGRLEAFTLIKNLLRFNYNIDKDFKII